MKVFKFYTDDHFYVYSGNDENEAREALIEELPFKIIINKVEEIPESEWDKKIINNWVDNDRSRKPYKTSIREGLFNHTPYLIYTNDLDF